MNDSHNITKQDSKKIKQKKEEKNNNKPFTRAFNNIVQSSPCKKMCIPLRSVDRDREAHAQRRDKFCVCVCAMNEYANSK